MPKNKDFRRLFMANFVMIACMLVWLVTADDPSMLTAVAVMSAFAICSYLATTLLLLWRRNRTYRCELCARKRGVPTDNTEWAHRHGLDVCNSCAFKLQIAFSNAEPPPGDGRVIH